MTERRQVSEVLLREHIVAALYGQRTYDVAVAAAHALDAGSFRVMTRLDVDDATGAGLEYVVELEIEPDRFAVLCAIHWSRLGLTEQDRHDEVACLLAQNGVGIPDDLSELDP